MNLDPARTPATTPWSPRAALAQAWASGTLRENPDVPSRPSGSGWRALPYLVILVYPVLTLLPWTMADVSGFPDNDYWSMILSLFRGGEIALSTGALLAPQNEHVVLLPKLLYYSNFLAFDGHNLSLRLMAMVIAAGCALALFQLLPAQTRADPALALLASIVIATLVFSYRASHSWYLGFSGIHWFLANVLFLSGLLAMRRAGEAGDRGVAWFVVGLLCALGSAFSYSTGLVGVPLIGAYALWLRLSRPWIAAYALAAIFLVLYFALAFETPAGHPALSLDLVTIAVFSAVFLGNAMQKLMFAAIAAVALAGLLASSTLALVLTRPRHFHAVVPFLLVAAYSVGNALLAAVSRAGFDIALGQSSRYVNVSALFAVSSLLVTLILLSLTDRRVPRAILCAALAILMVPLGVNATNPAPMRLLAERERDKHLAELALGLGIVDGGLLAAISPDTEGFAASLPAIRALRHAPFHRPHACAEPTGGTIGAQGAQGAQGSFDRLERLDEGQFLASGRVARAETGFACIAILDAADVVVGVGVVGLPGSQGVSAGEVGGVPWRAVMIAPVPTPPYSAAMRVVGDDVWRRVGPPVADGEVPRADRGERP